jgi:hypothetical protein
MSGNESCYVDEIAGVSTGSVRAADITICAGRKCIRSGFSAGTMQCLVAIIRLNIRSCSCNARSCYPSKFFGSGSGSGTSSASKR